MKLLNEFESDSYISDYLNVVESKIFDIKYLKDNHLELTNVFLKLLITKPHKKKLGAVFYIKDNKDLKSKKQIILKNAKKLNTNYFLVQPKIEGEEFIIGIKKDPTFGYVIMLGIGGSNVEKIKDVSFRKIPITKKDAISMIDDLQNQAIVLRINKQLLINSLLSIQKIVQKSNFKELDINPLIVNDKKAVVVDSKVYLK